MLNGLVRLKYVEVHHLQPLGVVTAERDGLIPFIPQHLKAGRAMVTGLEHAEDPADGRGRGLQIAGGLANAPGHLGMVGHPGQHPSDIIGSRQTLTHAAVAQ